MFDAYAALTDWKFNPVPPEIVAEVQEWCDSTAALHASLGGADDGETAHP